MIEDGWRTFKNQLQQCDPRVTCTNMPPYEEMLLLQYAVAKLPYLKEKGKDDGMV